MLQLSFELTLGLWERDRMLHRLNYSFKKKKIIDKVWIQT